MRDNLERLLCHALTPTEEPDACVNQYIVNSVRRMQAETNEAEMEVAMRKSWMRRVPVVALAAALVVSAGGLSAYAAWRYLKPEQVAVKTGDKKLAEAFQGGDSIRIDESQSYGGYTVTLLGTTSGKNLSQYAYESNGELKDDRTYAVVAIEKEDGTKISDSDQMSDLSQEESEFLVSPLIRGEDPRFINIYCMNGGSSTILEDGVLYRVVDCDNLEVFAERGVYLSVNHSTFFESEGYIFDKESGEITRNDDYKELNALFQLPLDVSKADEKAAQEQLRLWEEEMSGSSDEEDEDTEDGMQRDWNEKNLKKHAKLLSKTVQTLTPDKNGYIHCKKWSYGETSSGGSEVLVDAIFEKDFVGMSEHMTVLQDSKGKDLIETYTRNEDGTITMAVYHEK